MREPHGFLAVALSAALGLAGLGHHVLAHAADASPGATTTTTMTTAGLCESRTINYITHTLPQQCLRTGWSSANASIPATANATDGTPSSALSTGPEATAATVPQSEEAGENKTQGRAQEEDESQEDAIDIQDLATSSFMSFEEWKAIQLKKSGQDPADLQARKKQEHKAEPYPGASNGDLDSLGDDGEINLEFDVLSEKVSEMTASASPSAEVQATEAKTEDAVLYDDGRTQYYRSKDAGKTCKERFSYSSFDGGATVLKTTKGAKNSKAILVENKDSYMLFECRMDNKFVIVELSDDILVDTVVLANFEFFSSMIRAFRVSVSDRYPVKMEKWKDLGTFVARNSRDIQPFLVEHPQIWAKYIRIEFLTYYGNEFYCPISLLRVHGTRMLDSWKESEGGQDDDEETPEPAAIEEPPPTAQTEVGEVAPSNVSAVDIGDVKGVTEVGISPWYPVFFAEGANGTCMTTSPTTEEPTHVSPAPEAGDTSSSTKTEPASLSADGATPVTTGSEPVRTSPPPVPSAETTSAPASQPANITSIPPSSPPPTRNTTSNSTEPAPSPPQPSAVSKAPSAESPGSKQVASKPLLSKPPPPPPKQGSTTAIPKPSSSSSASKNRTASANQPASSPTVQESFFKTVTKRLQHLESNTSLSLQYIEDQSRFLQEALLKMERKQIRRVHAFLDTLNGTVLSELRSVRTQYDQIWQSTVLALEAQRDQSAREIVALSDRLTLLADEVVFQKRMAILQSALLLSCLALVIFSRATTTAASALVFPPPAAAPPRPSSPDAAPLSYASSPGPASPPRRRESTLARAHSYPEKVLPLTPTSDYARSPSPPAVRVVDSGASSYFDVDLDDDASSLRELVGDGDGYTPPPRRRGAKGKARFEEGGTSGEGSSLSRFTTSSEGGITSLSSESASFDDDDEGDAGRLSTPLARSSMGSGSARKPLPALPEDPT